MFEAHTQHKEKTAIEIVHIADICTEKFGGEYDTTLEEVRKQCGHDVDKERALLKSSIKGVGPTGLDIFFRRVQWLWIEAFPFMDERTKDAMAALGLPDDAEELLDRWKLIGRNWILVKWRARTRKRGRGGLLWSYWNELSVLIWRRRVKPYL